MTFVIGKMKLVSYSLLAYQSQRLMGELIVYQSLRRPSVRPQFQTTSPLKLLGQLNSNFIWRLLRTRERKFVLNGPGDMTKIKERSGSVVECLTRDRRAEGSSLTGVTALWSLSKTHLFQLSTGSTQEDPSLYN